MILVFKLPYASGDNVTNENSYKNHFLPRLKIKNYNIKIDGRSFYDQSINELIIQMMKSEKYQQDKVMIILLVVC